MSGTTTGVLPRPSHSATERARVSSLAAAGNASSTSFIRGTGLKTCRPTKRSGWPEAWASSATESEDVVLPITASSDARGPSRASSSALAEVSSTIASTRNVASLRASRSPTTWTREGSTFSSFPQVFSTVARARSWEPSERAQSTTSPCSAADAASPQAIAPDPAMPSLSFMRRRKVHDCRVNFASQQGVKSRMPGQQGREVVIVEAVRTPVGRGHKEKGYYKDTHPAELPGRTDPELLSRARVDPAEVEDVIAGCVAQFGEQALNVARNAWLQEGLPIEAAATTVDRQCGSAQQAVNFGAALIAAGIHDVVIGSGVEHMGHNSFADTTKIQQDYGNAFTPELLAKHNIVGQGLGAEMIAEEYEIPRSELDELAVRSHRLAAKATEEGKFEREMVAMKVNGDTFMTDQGIRPDTSIEAVSQLKPVFKPDGRITAANSSQISDGAAAVLLMSADKASELGLRPRARIVDQTTVGTDPVKMLEGPIPATAKLLKRNGITMDDIDYVEINEAFAPVVAAWKREHNPDMDRVNPRGGAMALGHPLGSTGARLITTLLHALEDDDKEVGLVTMCCGGGLGTGTIIQRI